MDKKTYCKRFMLWTAVVVAVLVALIGLIFGKVVEGSLTEEIFKWIVVGIGIVAIFECFAYILAPLFWHIKFDGKNGKKNLGMD